MKVCRLCPVVHEIVLFPTQSLNIKLPISTSKEPTEIIISVQSDTCPLSRVKNIF